MNTQAARQTEFDQNGFLIVREFLVGEQFARLQQELERYICDVVPGLPSGDAFYQDRNRPQTLQQIQHMGRDPFFDGYRENREWNQLAVDLLGEPASAQEPEWFNKPPGTEHPTPAHQDNFYFCWNPPQVLTMWLALDDADEKNGGLRYVAGSHKQGIRPHGPTNVLGFSQGVLDFGRDDLDREIAVSLKAGDLLVHHGNTIHRAEPNRSQNRQRRAFAMVFVGQSCQKDMGAFGRYQAALKSQHEKIGLGDA